VREGEVAELCRDLRAEGVTFWLVGGWGVDALLGRQTRGHHDVDVLVEVDSLERFLQRLHSLGFVFAYSWEESLPLRYDGWEGDVEQPSAFVLSHPDGREVDVHVLRVASDGAVTVLWDSRDDFRLLDPAGLSGEGVIAGERVPCFTAEMQRKAHTGYELPTEHVEDLRLLSKLRDG
jgi:lincosamide nucleotidyltransferase A/C/D/E